VNQLVNKQKFDSIKMPGMNVKKSTSPCSQQSVICPYPETDKFNPRNIILLT